MRREALDEYISLSINEAQELSGRFPSAVPCGLWKGVFVSAAVITRNRRASHVKTECLCSWCGGFSAALAAQHPSRKPVDRTTFQQVLHVMLIRLAVFRMVLF